MQALCLIVTPAPMQASCLIATPALERKRQGHPWAPWPAMLAFSASSRPIKDPDSRHKVDLCFPHAYHTHMYTLPPPPTHTYEPQEPKFWGKIRLQSLWIVNSKAREVDWLSLLSSSQNSKTCHFTMTTGTSLPLVLSSHPGGRKNW